MGNGSAFNSEPPVRTGSLVFWFVLSPDDNSSIFVDNTLEIVVGCYFTDTFGNTYQYQSAPRGPPEAT